jgi:hypothetical protein
VQQTRRRDENLREAETIKRGFLEKEGTRAILTEKLNDDELEVVQDDHLQFSRATRLAENTKRILISHDSENKQYSLFIMRMLELVGVGVEKSVIFTSSSKTGVPHGQNIYDYLKSCFREDIYVIFLFSRRFYDSNVCVAETGAAWATNRNHSNVIIDIDYASVDKPIDSAKQGFKIGDLASLNREEVRKFIKTVLSETQITTASDKRIDAAINTAVQEFQGKLGVVDYYPRRKYQGHPVCDKAGCGNTMELTVDSAGLCYVCQTPGCGTRLEAEIH